MRNTNNYLSKNPFDNISVQDFFNVNLNYFKIPEFRQIIAFKRWKMFEPYGKFSFSPDIDKSVLPDTIEYNKKKIPESLGNLSLLERSDLVLKPLMCIDKVNFNLANLKVLSIGPRTEYEILMLMGYGFKPENIYSLDLISYSPWIEAGDMHKLPYKENFFDVVILSWVLVYSSEPQKVIEQVVKVSKKNAIITIGCDYKPLTHYSVKENKFVYQNSFQILDYFPKIEKVYFNHEPSKNYLELEGNLIVTLEI